MAALQALKSVTKNLATTQNQISTGLRVAEASHNAAYWSIATTMRSDNNAISTVIASLGLGAATVDVMYSATNQIVDVLSEVKAKLVVAEDTSGDRHKIQQEISALVEHAQKTASSASFAGSSWLSTSEPKHLTEVDILATSITSSFSRDSVGTASVGTINVDLKAISMLNAGGGGILQKEPPSLGEIGGFRDTGFNSPAHNGHEDHLFTGPATFGVTDFIEFVMNVDGGDHSAGMNYTIRIDKNLIDAALGTTDGVIRTALDMRTVLETAFVADAVPATTNSVWAGGMNSDWFEIGSLEILPDSGSSIEILSVTSTFPGGFALGLEDNPYKLDHDNMYPSADVAFTDPFTLWDGAEFYFDVQIGGAPLATVTVDNATVNAALGTSDGYIGTAADMAAVIQFAAQGQGLSVTASGSTMTFSGDQSIYPEAGNAAPTVYVGNVHDNIGYRLPFDLAEIDIVGGEFKVEDYLQGVEHMLSKSITSAALLGSIKQRIGLQAELLSELKDAVSRGVGQLVDANMNTASARLFALQTQQQLATQSLQIANSAPQMILQLFR